MAAVVMRAGFEPLNPARLLPWVLVNAAGTCPVFEWISGSRLGSICRSMSSRPSRSSSCPSPSGSLACKASRYLSQTDQKTRRILQCKGRHNAAGCQQPCMGLLLTILVGSLCQTATLLGKEFLLLCSRYCSLELMCVLTSFLGSGHVVVEC